MPTSNNLANFIFNANLLSREEVNTAPCPVPNQPGIYAWFFRRIPERVPTKACYERDGFTLLYLGIAPSRATSKASLRRRIRNQHLNGNAYGSTLRFTLACLLGKELGAALAQHGSRLSLGENEAKHNQWLSENARVAHLVLEEPWIYEAALIRQFDLPLNLQHNQFHPFYPILKALRSEARLNAKNASGQDEPQNRVRL